MNRMMRLLLILFVCLPFLATANLDTIPRVRPTETINPHEMNGLVMPDPIDGINIMEPPSANAYGTAALDYPLTLPEGRNGMTPDLRIGYNHENSGGWLGQGWDFGVESITIDTRWGVPRFDPENETETYLLNGSMLSPVAHRAFVEQRSAEKQFFERVEQDFNKIIRHGNNTGNYWWEVTDKSGRKYFYGGSLENGLESNSILTNIAGDIVQWNITSSIDVYGNNIKYEYAAVSDPGVANSTIPGKNIYLKYIYYSGIGIELGKYKIEFTRDRELGEAKKADVLMDLSLGFKQVDVDLLRKIDITYNDESVRSYELNYSTAVFHKTILNNLIEFDREGAEFYRHSFEYFDEVSAGTNQYNVFAPEEAWIIDDDQLDGGLVLGVTGFNDEAPVLGASHSNTTGGGGALTFGPIGSFTDKINSIGGNLHYAQSKGNGISMLVDINGDNLPDKVFQKDGALFYRPNLRTNLGNSFGLKRPINGITEFTAFKVTSFSGGAEVNFPIAFAGWENTTDKTKVETFLMDFNSDGLIDVAHRGTVWFNHLDSNGDPTFTKNASDTPSPIIKGANIDYSNNVIDPAEQDELIDQFPLHDVVRVWVAPFDGNVAVVAPVELIEFPAAADYGKNDGLRVAIQLRETELWNTTIDPNDFTLKNPTGLGNLNVTKGDRIYFRLQSIFDGAFDQVNWDPIVQYNNEDLTTMDADSNEIYSYQASEDLLLAACQSVSLPLAGTISIKSLLNKPQLSDSITVEIKIENAANNIYQQIFPWDAVFNDSLNFENITVNEGDLLLINIKCKTNVDWQAIDWRPLIFYTEAGSISVFDDDGNPTYSYCPAVDYRMYNHPVNKSNLWQSPVTDTIEIIGDPAFLPPLPIPLHLDGTLTLTVKGKNKLYAQECITLDNPLSYSPLHLEAIVDQNDSLYIEYHVDNPILAAQIVSPDVQIVVNGNSENFEAGLYSGIIARDSVMGPLYRRWGQFIYNGNRARAVNPINESELNLDNSSMFDDDLLDQDTLSDDQINDLDSPTGAPFVVMFLDVKTGCWGGVDNLTFIKPDGMSSSRLGEDDILLTLPGNGNTSDFSAPIIESKSNSNALAAGVGAGITAGGSIAWGTTKNIRDIGDFNGDGYPDIAEENRIQYTLPTGGLEPAMTGHNFGSHEVKSFAVSGGLGGSYVSTSANTTGETSGAGSNKKGNRRKFKVTVSGARVTDSEEGSKQAIGISGSYGTDRDSIIRTFLDINGDGLDDVLERGGDVYLNTGRGFIGPENWGFNEVRTGLTTDYGGGVGVNLFNGSIVSGVSVNRSEGELDIGFQDLNGDGLVDYFRKEDERIYVQLNTGTGLASEKLWDNISGFERGNATAESVNGAFTVCINFFPFFRICVNPDISTSQGLSQQIDQISDVDGDGMPDFVRSTADNEFLVRKSLIGKSNLLKKINTPLDASYTLDYDNSPNSYEVPSAKNIFSSLIVNDGTPGDGVDVAKSTFVYEGGKYDRHERSFFGYEKVNIRQLDENDALYRTVQIEFNTANFYTKGQLQSQAVLNADGNTISRTEYSYANKDPETGLDVPPANLALDYGRVFPALIEQRELFYEGATTAGLQSRLVFEYDLFGNLIKEINYDDGSPENLVESIYKYHNLAAKNILNVPSQILIQSPAGSLRRTETSVNDFGETTQVRKYLASGIAATYDLEYDEVGNITKMTRPANEAGERLAYDFEYDAEKKYVMRVEDSYGLANEFETDPRSGKILKSVDINGHETNYTIDKYNRLESITGPYELTSGAPYSIFFEYHHDAATPYAIAKHYDAELKEDVEIYNFTDGLGREVQNKKTATITSASGNEQSVLIVSGLNKFDAFGRIAESFQPTTESIGANNINYNTSPDSIAPTKYTYDPLDRFLTITKPTGSTNTFVFDITQDLTGNNALRTTITNAKGNNYEQYFDLGNNLIAIKANGPSGDIWTQYVLNGMGELEAEIDQLGNTTFNEYDQLGRKIKIEYPDAGLTELKYDLNDNLIQRVTSNIRAILPDDVEGAIRYKYEFERLVGIDYPKNFQNKVQLHYGEAGADFNRAGKVWLQEDGSGGQEFYYGIKGEIEKTIRTVLISEANVQTYISTAKYDSWNRMLELVYPDGEIIDFEYNRGGRLKRMTSKKSERDYVYINQLGFDKFENQTFINYGNDVTTAFAFDDQRNKLNHLTAEGPFGKIADYRLDYDPNGNITRLQNDAITLADQIGGAAVHTYEYDELDRLESAAGEWKGQGENHSYQYLLEYNELDKIALKSQRHLKNGSAVPGNTFTRAYQYENPEKPHTPNIIGARAVEYDPNGNLKIWNSNTSYAYQQHLWDEESRLLGTSLNGKIAQFTYDAYGERSIKSHGDVQGVFVDGAPAGLINHLKNYTAYVSPYFTVEENEFHKHYFINEERFLTKRGVGQFDFNLISDQGIAAGNINYSRRAQELRNAIQEYYATLGVPPGPPTLQGLYGQPEINAISLPNAEANNPYGVPPPNWPILPQQDSLSPPGPPVFYAPAPTHDNIQPGYGFLGNPVIPEIDCSFYHYDPAGNVTNISDFNGRIRQHIAYFPSGEIWVEKDTLVDKQPYLYAGKEYDRESGLFYFGDRYFDSNHSLWQSPDPELQDYGLKTLDTRPAGKQFYTYSGPRAGAGSDPGVAAGSGTVIGGASAVNFQVSDEDIKKLKNLKKGFDYLKNKIKGLFKSKEDVKKKNRSYQIHPNNPESQEVAAQALKDVKAFNRKQQLNLGDDDESRIARRKLRGELRKQGVGVRKARARPKASGAKTRLRN